MRLLIPIAALGLLAAEVWAVVAVASAVGVLPTIGLLVATSFLGGWLVKREGRRAWRTFERAAADGQLPQRAVSDGALVLVGGLLMIPPGFVTDAVGLACLLPPTRWLLRGGLVALARRRVATRVINVRSTRGPDVPPEHPVIEGEVDR